MKNSCVLIFLLILILVQKISSVEVIIDDQNDDKSDDVRQISSLPYYSSLSSDVLSDGKQTNGPECLSKNLLLNVLSRGRRASISRPYFQHWRASRDSSRYISKNLLAFSPRLGKRSYEDDHESDVPMKKRHVEEDNGMPDLDAFLVTLIGHLQEKKIGIVYEDATKICLSEMISNALIKEVVDKFDINRSQQEEQDKEEAQEQYSKGKHPLLFRYRLG